MLRRMTLAVDNVPLTTRLSENISGSSGSVFVETGFVVSYVIVQNASVGQISTDDEKGPYFYNTNSPTTDLVYNVGTISGEPGIKFISDTIEVHLNGVLLTKDVDYTENANNEDFTLVVDGGPGLNVNPGASDEFMLKFIQNISFTAPTSSTDIVARIPSTGTGFYVDYQNISGSMIAVDLLYR